MFTFSASVYSLFPSSSFTIISRVTLLFILDNTYAEVLTFILLPQLSLYALGDTEHVKLVTSNVSYTLICFVLLATTLMSDLSTTIIDISNVPFLFWVFQTYMLSFVLLSLVV